MRYDWHSAYVQAVCNGYFLIKSGASSGVDSSISKREPSSKRPSVPRDDFAGSHIICKVMRIATTMFDTLPKFRDCEHTGVVFVVDR